MSTKSTLILSEHTELEGCWIYFYFLFLDLDSRSRRDVLNPLTESVFYGHASTQLLNSYSSYDDELYTVL